MAESKRPTHEGNVTIKDGEAWRKIGECAVWLNEDGSISGVLTVEGSKYNFRAWKTENIEALQKQITDLKAEIERLKQQKKEK